MKLLDGDLGPAVPHIISENIVARSTRRRGRPRTRIEVEDVPRLHLPSMIATGQVVPGEIVRTDLPGALGTVVAEMRADRGQLVVQPFGARCYLVQVVSDPQPFGGRRWWLVCPITGRRAASLYQPLGANRFASREAHGLTYRTQRLDARGRVSGSSIVSG